MMDELEATSFAEAIGYAIDAYTAKGMTDEDMIAELLGYVGSLSDACPPAEYGEVAEEIDEDLLAQQVRAAIAKIAEGRIKFVAGNAWRKIAKGDPPDLDYSMCDSWVCPVHAIEGDAMWFVLDVVIDAQRCNPNDEGAARGMATIKATLVAEALTYAAKNKLNWKEAWIF